MNLHVLGCAGGIGGRERVTTCLRLDDDILLDAGTGLTNLDIDQLVKIDHIFLTHSHLDHVTGLALLVDTVTGKRNGPITVYATPIIIDALKKHLFNWVLWPDFTVIPSEDNPILRLEPMEAGTTIALNGRSITAHPVNHMPGAVAYWVHNTKNGFLFSGDLCSSPALWAALAQEKTLRKVIIDCSFPNAETDLAAKSMHFCPQALLDDTCLIAHSVEFLIYHLKPGQEDLIMSELSAAAGKRTFTALKQGDVFVF